MSSEKGIPIGIIVSSDLTTAKIVKPPYSRKVIGPWEERVPEKYRNLLPHPGDILVTNSRGDRVYLRTKGIKRTSKNESFDLFSPDDSDWFSGRKRSYMTIYTKILGKYDRRTFFGIEEPLEVGNWEEGEEERGVVRLLSKRGMIELFEEEQDLSLGNVTVHYTNQEGRISKKGTQFKVSTSSMFDGLLVVGGKKRGKTYFAQSLLEQIYKNRKKQEDTERWSTIIFDTRGEYIRRKSGNFLFLDQANFLSVRKAKREMSKGFGLQWMSSEEILSRVGSLLSSKEYETLKKILGDLDSPLTLKKIKEHIDMENVVRILKEQFGGGSNALDGKITVIDFKKEAMSYTERERALNNILAELFEEKLRRSKQMSENRRPLILLFENAELFTPKPGQGRSKITSELRDRVLDFISNSSVLQTCPILVSSNPSKLHPSLFYLIKNHAVTAFSNPRKMQTVQEQFLIGKEELYGADFGEFLLSGNFTPFPGLLVKFINE